MSSGQQGDFAEATPGWSGVCEDCGMEAPGWPYERFCGGKVCLGSRRVLFNVPAWLRKRRIEVDFKEEDGIGLAVLTG